MDEPTLRKIAERVLIKLLSGSGLEPSLNSSRQAQIGARTRPDTIEFRTVREEPYRIPIKRSQGFSNADLQLVRTFCAVVHEMAGTLQADYLDEFIPIIERRIVARALSGANPIAFKQIVDVLDQLSIWSSTSYEGSRIAAAIGLAVDQNGFGPALAEITDSDFFKVLSNGIDTMVVFGGNGLLVSHWCESQAVAGAPPKFVPHRLTRIAGWADGVRLAFVLNRLGEQLVFENQQLKFAMRSRHWYSLSHDVAIQKMRFPYQDRTLRENIYESAIDASFARTGACVGVISYNRRLAWAEEGIVSPDDLLSTSTAPKATAIRTLIDGRRFGEMDRRLRQELLAIDGAVVIDETGQIITVGAILKVPAGSTGGGRKAASIQLGNFGLGIKTSQDGGIACYQGGRNTPAFSLMC